MSHINQFEHLKIQLQAIQLATNNFSDENYIGRGGFGKVYKGEVVHSKGKTMVAFKRLDRKFGQGDSEFWKEIMMLSFYKHESVISLLGYCDDHDEKILVYEYASNKSLESCLANEDLTWVQRLKICIGAASGLAYLHSPAETQLRIVHRDIKSSNILLDSNWNAKISDFGLSKFAPANNQFTYLVSNPAGTQGYIDPLYLETGLLTKESDVYSFGVVLFEVLCGRLCLCFGDKDVPPLVGMVRKYYQQKKISELVFDSIKDEINITSLKLFVDIAYQCLNRERENRPLMTKIARTLQKALDIQEKPDVHGPGILTVKVHRTSYTGSKYPQNYYFILEINGLDLLPQRVKVKLNEECTLYVDYFHDQYLDIHVNEVKSVKKHRYLGRASKKLSDLTHEIPQTCKLYVWDDFNHCIGHHLTVEVLYKQLAYDHIRTNIETLSSTVQKTPLGTPKDGGLLVIIIHNAVLYHREPRHPSVTLLLRGELKKTTRMMDTSKPMWLQEFTFTLDRPPTDEKLHLEITDNSWMGLIPGMGSLGRVAISLAGVVNLKRTYETREFLRGFLFVELQWRNSN